MLSLSSWLKLLPPPPPPPVPPSPNLIVPSKLKSISKLKFALAEAIFITIGGGAFKGDVGGGGGENLKIKLFWELSLKFIVVGGEIYPPGGGGKVGGKSGGG